MGIRDDMREMGYSKEDEYFYKKDLELIEKMREATNLRKKELEEKHQGEPYWMKCPKCGSDLTESVLENVVRIETCSGCGGQFFDHGELDLLFKARIAGPARGVR